MNGDLITGAAGVDMCGHLIGKQVKASPGELHTGQRKHPGELARHIHLLRSQLFILKTLLMQENLGARQPLLGEAALGDRGEDQHVRLGNRLGHKA